MGTLSTAIGEDRISRTSGFNIKKGNFGTETQNLPHIIAVFGEANTANQSGLTTAKVEVTSAAEAAELFGNGSPIHRAVSILRPQNGDGVGGIPTVIFPQLTDEDATATVRAWTVTGTATGNATHNVVINGRTSINFETYSFNVVEGDTPTVIAGKIAAAISAVLGAPCTATSALAVCTATTKWKGLSSKDFYMTIDPGDDSAGVTYSQSSSTDGAGDVDLAPSFALIGDVWYTDVVNTYGTAKLAEFEQFNGLPNDTNPTGRYSGIEFKPFAAYFGSTLSDKDDLATITNAAGRINQVTNVLCPAPNSKGFPFEAAANACALAAIVYQNTPNIDVSGLSYPDMPVPNDEEIGDMKEYNNRDFLVKKGCSTVMLVNGAYQIQDLVTTYHPAGEVPLAYNYVRTLNIIWNVKDSYSTLERIYLTGKTLVADGQLVNVDNCVKPKEWKATVYNMFDEEAEKALIKEPQFSKDSMQTKISTTNPNRFDTIFDFKTTGTVRISSTTARAGF